MYRKSSNIQICLYILPLRLFSQKYIIMSWILITRLYSVYLIMYAKLLLECKFDFRGYGYIYRLLSKHLQRSKKGRIFNDNWAKCIPSASILCRPVPIRSGSTSLALTHIWSANSLTVILGTFLHWNKKENPVLMSQHWCLLRVVNRNAFSLTYRDVTWLVLLIVTLAVVFTVFMSESE